MIVMKLEEFTMLEGMELQEVYGGGKVLAAIGAVGCGVGGFLTGGVAGAAVGTVTLPIIGTVGGAAAGAWGGAITGATTCGLAGVAIN